LIGDIHQPLHTATRGNDRGGNSVSVTFFGEETNLHRLWDSGIIQEERLSVTDIAQRLDSWLETQNNSAIATGSTVDWVLASHALALNDAYRNGEGSVQNDDRLGSAYFNQNEDVVNQQLARAGVRLA